MRIGNLGGRAVVAVPGGALDVAHASGGLLPADPHELLARWDSLGELDLTRGSVIAVEESALGVPCPAPRQVFAIGLNYREHASEAGFAVPERPTVFTKYVSSFSPAHDEVVLPSGSVDWEVELVVVLGRQARRVPAEHGWSYVAGVTVGQDLSERAEQLAGPAPQFGMAKSYPGFSPIGPWLVTPDELADPDDLELGCAINGKQVQKGRTSDMVFAVPELVARLSHNVTLYPGDVIFTGTPAGIGNAREPKWFLAPGDELTSYVESVGSMRHVMRVED